MRLLTDIVRDGAMRYPHKKALAIRPRYRTITWAYQELFKFAESIERFLKERGVNKGDRVLLWASNSPYWLGTFFGCLMRGVIVVPLHTENTPEFIKKIREQTQPKLFLKSSNLSLILEEVTSIDIDYLDRFLEEQTIQEERDSGVEISEDDIAEILYTSGTTGEPKGVILTHKNIISNLQSVWAIIDVSQNDRVLAVLPLSHIFEQIVEFRALAAGAFIVYAPALSSSLIKKTLKEYRVTKMATVPEFLKRVITRIEQEAKRKGKAGLLSLLFSASRLIPIRSIRRLLFSNIHKQFGGKLDLIVSGGAALDVKVAKKWHNLGVQIIQGYGLTETSPVLAALKPSDPFLESVGKVVPGVIVKIAEDGEILAKGPNITQGYWQDEKKTSDVFTQDGWFRTGDLGYFDKNDYLYLRGRKKFIILTPSGQNVYPEDIETELNREPEVEDSAVIGFEKDGTILIHAVLLGDIRDPEEIIIRANKRLASFQRIQSWSVWPFNDFPRTITRKVKRHEVLDYLQKQEVPAEMHKKGEEVSLFMRIVGEVINRSPSFFRKDMPIVSLGLDSLARIELVARIEEELGVEIDEAQITPKTTMDDLEKLVVEKPVVKIKHAPRAWPLQSLTKQIRAILYWMFVVPISKVFIKIRVEGLENIKDLESPLMFMPNHISDLDTQVMHLALPTRIRRNLAVATATDILFEKFWYLQSIAMLLFNSYPFPRRGQTRMGLEYTGKLLDRGWSILFFPEGRIPDPHERLILKEGTGLVVCEMHVPVVPVKIEGTQYVMPRGTHFPQRRGEVRVKFGKPLYFERRTPYREAMQCIQDELRNL